jgi:hypothetical protein
MALTPWLLPPDEDSQLVAARARLGTVLALLLGGQDRDPETPLTPLEVTEFAQMMVEVCCRPNLPQRLYAIAVAYDATLPRKLAPYQQVRTAYKRRGPTDPGSPDAVPTVRKIISHLADVEEKLPGRPFDPRTDAEAALEAGGWSHVAIAMLTDPDHHPWQEGDGARRVARRLARYRSWYGRVFGPPACFFTRNVKPRISPSSR